MSDSIGPANDTALEVTQEKIAVRFAAGEISYEELPHLDTFLAGLYGHEPVEPLRYIWETGALARLLMETKKP